MSEAWWYVAILTGVAMVALQLLLLLRAALARERLDTRLRELQGGLERLERELRQEMALGRQEAASAARGDREAQSLSVGRLSQTLASQMA